MSTQTRPAPASSEGLTAGQAKGVEYAIITLCVAALLFIFQPFSLTLFTVGCVLVVIGGLAFNLVPLCRPGVTVRTLVKATGIILLILLIVAGLGMLSAYGYVVWLQGTR